MIGIEAKGVIFYLRFAIILSVVNLLPIKVYLVEELQCIVGD
jgi:hypothetical protein